WLHSRGSWFHGGRRIIGDQNRSWILGYNKYLGNCSIFYAEPWGILECLSLIVEYDY
ncbi:hypothetical protein Gogos_014447, partial [Gossypium gossypioides]|nr:hypothetical protein [Gossypium gossypioides]